MMPAAGPPPLSFMLYSLLFSFIAGVLFSLVYATIKTGVPASNNTKKGLFYGLLVFLVAGVPGALSMYLLINLPSMLIVFWTLENFVIYLVNGLITAKIIG